MTLTSKRDRTKAERLTGPSLFSAHFSRDIANTGKQ